MTETRIRDVGRLAWLPSSRVTKWLVLGFWLVILAVSFGPAGKLQGALNNEAASWLPENAQSTQVAKQIEAFQSKNEAPAVLVYERPDGVTAADLHAVAAHVTAFNALEPVKKDSVGPIPSEDGKAIQVIVPMDIGEDGWENLAGDHRPGALDRSRTVRTASRCTSPARSALAPTRRRPSPGIDGKLLYAAMAVVIIILLITYRSPILWLIPVISAGTALFISQAVIYYLADSDSLTVNAQSSAILTVIVFGAGTDYALLLVARYREELRTAPGPSRGDGLRPAPCRPCDLRLGRHRHRRHALPPRRDDELDQGPRPGRRDRHRRRPARHADPATGPARRLRTLDLLAGPSDLRLRRPHPRRLLGPDRRPHRPRPAPHLGRHVASSWPSPPSASSSSTRRAWRTRTPSTRRPSPSSARRSWPGTSQPGPAHRCSSWPTRTRPAAVQDQLESRRRRQLGGRPDRRATSGRSSRRPSATRPTPTRPRKSVDRIRDAIAEVPGCRRDRRR